MSLPYPTSMAAPWLLLLAALASAAEPAPGAPAKAHWAFKAPVRPGLPVVEEGGWPLNPIDHFILARLEREGLRPAGAAEKTTLLRRLSLDLIGLPPTPEEIDSFLGDPSPEAYGREVERLLASPHYGERQSARGGSRSILLCSCSRSP